VASQDAAWRRQQRTARGTQDPAAAEEFDDLFLGYECGEADDGRSGPAASSAQPDHLGADVRVARTAAGERRPEPEAHRTVKPPDRLVDVVDRQLERLKPNRPSDRVRQR
jgi:hypothetical protein